MLRQCFGSASAVRRQGCSTRAGAAGLPRTRLSRAARCRHHHRDSTSRGAHAGQPLGRHGPGRRLQLRHPVHPVVCTAARGGWRWRGELQPDEWEFARRHPRRPPGHQLRAPQQHAGRMTAVTVDGAAWAAFDATAETVDFAADKLGGLGSSVRVVATVKGNGRKYRHGCVSHAV